jgi:hypothetical protein
MTRFSRAKHDWSRLPLVFALTVILTLVLLWPVSQVVVLLIRVVAPVSATPMPALWVMTAMSLTVVLSLAVAALMASMLFRFGVRLDGGHEGRRTDLQDECRRCGYSLDGLTSDRCPECGEAIFGGAARKGEG